MRRALPYLLVAVMLGFAFYPRPGRSAEGDTWLGVNGLSYHFARDRGYNERNSGLGFEHHITDNWAVAGGSYKNSYFRRSNYMGAVYTPWHYGTPDGLKASIGGALWFVSGYEENPVPIPFGVVALEHKRVGMNIGVSPVVVMFQLKFKLN